MKTIISDPVRRVLFSVALLGLLWGGSEGWAQITGQPQPQQAQEVPLNKIGTVTVKFVGTANVNEQVVRANMQMRDGGEFDDNTIDKDIRALYRTQLFEYVEVKMERVSGNSFNILITYESSTDADEFHIRL